MKKNGFNQNPYEPCIANKVINGKQCTICWHVDDNKISHEDPKVVDEVIKMIKDEFHDVTVKRGDEHTFIGMNVKMNQDGTVTLSMKEYIEESIKAFNEDLGKKAKTPAGGNLFNVSYSDDLDEHLSLIHI